MDFKDKKVLVFGSGISGIGACELLEKSGATVILFDGNEKLHEEAIRMKLPSASKAQILIGQISDEQLKELDLVVLSPGVPTDLPVVEKMKAGIPNLTLSTDIIVGFPGETDEEFEDTLDVVEKVKFEQVYMFIYSRRVGTPGDKMENQVPEEQKHVRFDKLKALVESQIAENNKKYVGTTQKVLVEGTSKNNENMLTGRTDSNKVVIFEGDKSLIGSMIELKIVSEHMWYLKGELKF